MPITFDIFTWSRFGLFLLLPSKSQPLEIALSDLSVTVITGSSFGSLKDLARSVICISDIGFRFFALSVCLY